MIPKKYFSFIEDEKSSEINPSVENNFNANIYNQHHHIINENKIQERENAREELFYHHPSNSHNFNSNSNGLLFNIKKLVILEKE